MDSNAVGKTLVSENVSPESLVAAAAEEVTAVVTLDQQRSPEVETPSTDHKTELDQAAATVKEMGLFPGKTVTLDTAGPALEEVNNGRKDQARDFCQYKVSLRKTLLC